MNTRIAQWPVGGMLALAILLAGSWASLSQAQDKPATKPGSASKNDSDASAGPKIIAVKFHADWCGYCKQMGDVFEEMQAKFDREPVLWITLDQTRQNGRTQSQYLANALKMQDIWKEHGGKTGFVLLVDTESRKVVDKLTSDQSLKEMGAKLLDAVKKTES